MCLVKKVKMTNNTLLDRFYVPPADKASGIRHLFGLGKFHRWTRSFPDHMIEHDLPNIIHFSPSMSAYFALGFPEQEGSQIIIGCQLSEADWLNLIDIVGVSIDAKNNYLYLLVKGYSVLKQQFPPLALGVPLNTGWKAKNLQKFNHISFYLVDVKGGKVTNSASKPFKKDVEIFHSSPGDLFNRISDMKKEQEAPVIQKMKSLI